MKKKQKKISLKKHERETIINYNAEEKKGTIYTSIKKDIKKLDKLSKEFPEKYKLIKKDEVSKTYEFDKKLCSIRRYVKMNLTDDEKQRRSERLKYYRKSKLKD